MALISISKAQHEAAGSDNLPPARYIVDIVSAAPYSSDKNLVIGYHILASVAAPQAAGRYSLESFQLDGKGLDKLSTLYKRLGIQPRGTPSEDALAFDSDDLIGKRLVVDVVIKKLERRDGSEYHVSQWDWGKYWPMDHADVADFILAVRKQREPVPPLHAAPAPAVPASQASAPPAHDDEV